MNYENKDANMNLFNFAGVEKICVENNSSVHCTTETEWIFTKPSSPIPMNLESKSLFVDESFHLNVPSKFSSDLELPSCLKKTTELKSLRNVHRHIKFSTVEEILFDRDIGFDAVPHKGGYPLGLGQCVSVPAETISDGKELLDSTLRTPNRSRSNTLTSSNQAHSHYKLTNGNVYPVEYHIGLRQSELYRRALQEKVLLKPDASKRSNSDCGDMTEVDVEEEALRPKGNNQITYSDLEGVEVLIVPDDPADRIRKLENMNANITSPSKACLIDDSDFVFVASPQRPEHSVHSVLPEGNKNEEYSAEYALHSSNEEVVLRFETRQYDFKSLKSRQKVENSAIISSGGSTVNSILQATTARNCVVSYTNELFTPMREDIRQLILMRENDKLYSGQGRGHHHRRKSHGSDHLREMGQEKEVFFSNASISTLLVEVNRELKILQTLRSGVDTSANGNGKQQQYGTTQGCDCHVVTRVREKVDKFTVVKLKSELFLHKSRLLALFPDVKPSHVAHGADMTDDMFRKCIDKFKKAELISKLKQIHKAIETEAEAVASKTAEAGEMYCQLCADNNCYCFSMGVGCDAATCGCLRELYATESPQDAVNNACAKDGKSRNRSRSRSISVDVPDTVEVSTAVTTSATDVKPLRNHSCGNPFGTVFYDPMVVSAYRKQLIQSIYQTNAQARKRNRSRSNSQSIHLQSLVTPSKSEEGTEGVGCGGRDVDNTGNASTNVEMSVQHSNARAHVFPDDTEENEHSIFCKAY